MNWRIRELVREAFRNRGSVHYIVTALITAVISALGILTLMQGKDALGQVHARYQAGGLVWQIATSAASPLDGTACDALNYSHGVIAAGGIAAAESSPVRAFSITSAIPTKVITPRALDVWMNDASSTVVGHDLEELGSVAVGSRLQDVRGRDLIVEGRTTADVAPEQLRSNLLITGHAHQPLVTCWVKFTPGAYASARALLEYSFGENQEAQITPYLPEPENVATPSQQWHALMDRQPWLVVGGIVGVVLAFATWARRAEFAVYRTFGTSRTEAVIIAGLEAVGICVVALACAVIVVMSTGAIVYGTIGHDLVGAVVRLMASASLVALAISTAINALIVSGNIATALKDR